METFLRLRPPANGTKSRRYCFVNDTPHTASADDHCLPTSCEIHTAGHSRNNQQQATASVSTTPGPAKIETLSFDGIFQETAVNSDVYDRCVRSSIASLFTEEPQRASDGILFTLGVTGSGKTHTIFGNSVNHPSSDQGIAYRALADIFAKVSSSDKPRKLGKYEVCASELLKATDEPMQCSGSVDADVFLSFAELYNDKFYDLLSRISCSATDEPSALTLRKRPNSDRRDVSGLLKAHCRSLQLAKQLITDALLQRRVLATKLNTASSRSHAILTIEIRARDPIGRSGIHSAAEYTIVDLAGSERAKATGLSNAVSGSNGLAEAGQINLSLMALGQCLEALRSATVASSAPASGTATRKPVFPSKMSKLTQVLFDARYWESALEQSASRATASSGPRVCMLVCIDPCNHVAENVNGVLRYAANARAVRSLSRTHFAAPTAATQAHTIPRRVGLRSTLTSSTNHSIKQDPRLSGLSASSSLRSCTDDSSDANWVVHHDPEEVENEDSLSDHDNDAFITPRQTLEGIPEDLGLASVVSEHGIESTCGSPAEEEPDAEGILADALPKLLALLSTAEDEMLAQVDTVADDKEAALESLLRELAVIVPLPTLLRGLCAHVEQTTSAEMHANFDAVLAASDRSHRDRLADERYRAQGLQDAKIDLLRSAAAANGGGSQIVCRTSTDEQLREAQSVIAAVREENRVLSAQVAALEAAQGGAPVETHVLGDRRSPPNVPSYNHQPTLHDHDNDYDKENSHPDGRLRSTSLGKRKVSAGVLVETSASERPLYEPPSLTTTPTKKKQHHENKGRAEDEWSLIDQVKLLTQNGFQ
ncbi:hypothetical protein PYCC9005_000803 [Savitreella phatthalungensis]